MKYKDESGVWRNISVKVEDTLDEYSTEEQVVGTWIDGKPIYRKVFTGVYNDGDILISNVDKIIKIGGSGDVGTGTIRCIPYFEIYLNKYFILTVNLQNNNIKVASALDGEPASTTSNTIIIIEYTKTTD